MPSRDSETIKANPKKEGKYDTKAPNKQDTANDEEGLKIGAVTLVEGKYKIIPLKTNRTKAITFQCLFGAL